MNVPGSLRMKDCKYLVRKITCVNKRVKAKVLSISSEVFPELYYLCRGYNHLRKTFARRLDLHWQLALCPDTFENEALVPDLLQARIHRATWGISPSVFHGSRIYEPDFIRYK